MELDVAENDVAVVLAKLTACVAGTAPFTVWENDKEEGVAVTVAVGLACNVKVTGKLMVVDPPVIATDPV